MFLGNTIRVGICAIGVVLAAAGIHWRRGKIAVGLASLWIRWIRVAHPFGIGKALRVGLVAVVLLAAVGCDALPDSVKSNRMIANEIWDCLDSDTRSGAALFGGKDWWLELMADGSSKEELIAMREEECVTPQSLNEASPPPIGR